MLSTLRASECYDFLAGAGHWRGSSVRRIRPEHGIRLRDFSHSNNFPRRPIHYKCLSKNAVMASSNCANLYGSSR